jgi:hypothetical protein
MLTAQQLLDAIWGPTYLVDHTGSILLVGRRHWSRHVGNAPGQPDPQSLIGRNLFEFISGGDVQALYRQILERIRSDPEHVWELDYRCDSPGMRRELRMTVSAVTDAPVGHALFSSQVLREGQRPPLSIFEYDKALAALRDPAVPLLMICSMCHRVLAKPGHENDAANWVEPEQYYRTGGSAHVSLSHGLCPVCYSKFMAEAGLLPRQPLV